MTEREYKIIVGVLLVTNVICLICICVLVGEVNSLQLKLSDMADTVRSLNDKMTRIEGAQEKTLHSEKIIEKGNVYILGGVITMIALIALVYFGGIDPWIVVGECPKPFRRSIDHGHTDPK